MAVGVLGCSGTGTSADQTCPSPPRNFVEALPHVAHPGVELCVEPCVLGYERADFSWRCLLSSRRSLLPSFRPAMAVRVHHFRGYAFVVVGDGACSDG